MIKNILSIANNMSIIALVAMMVTSCNKTDIPKVDKQLVQDDNFKFKIYVPEKWSIYQSEDNQSFFRVSASPESKSQTISVYAFRAKEGNEIDKKKLKESVTDYLNVGKQIVTTKTYDEYYDDKTKIYSTIITKTDRNYGYYIMYQSYDKNSEIYKPYLFSIKTNVPFFMYLIKTLLSYIVIPALFCLIGAFMSDKKLKKKWPIIGGILSPFIAIPAVLYLDVLDGTGLFLFIIGSPFFIILGYYGYLFTLEKD